MSEGVLGREYGNGEVICRQGEPGDRMYVIQAGRATVVREENGAEVVVGELGAGDVFGEMAIFDRQPRSATVRATGTARVLTLDKRAFLRGVHEDPSLAYRILQEMSHRIRRLDEELSQVKPRPATGPMTPDHARHWFIVSRDQSELCDHLTRTFSDDDKIQVLLDRRRGERRQQVQRQEPERRRADRRRASLDRDLRSRPFVVIHPQENTLSR